MRHRFRPLPARALLAAAVAVQLAVLYWPSPVDTGATLVPGADKVVHLLVFAAVALAGRLARVPLPLLAVLLVGHAVVSELVQHHMLSRRSGDPWDLAADVAGVLAGLAAPLRRRARDRADLAR